MRDKNIVKVYGVGFIGDGSYKSNQNINGINSVTKSHKIWRDMIRRCYSKEHQENNPSYIGCLVSDEWLNYQNFAKWFEENYVDGYQLDKDILIKNNKIYSESTCCFVPNEINSQFVKPILSGELPTGVYKRSNGKYTARVRKYGKKISCGIFDTVEQANTAYKISKKFHIVDLANSYVGSLSIECYMSLINYEV